MILKKHVRSLQKLVKRCKVLEMGQPLPTAPWMLSKSEQILFFMRTFLSICMIRRAKISLV